MKVSTGIGASRALQTLKSKGALASLKLVISYIGGEKPIESFNEIKAYFVEKTCLEIGGPSRIFQQKSILPIYALVNNIDNVNFSATAVQEKKGLLSAFPKNKVGHQFICEATELSRIKDESYDCVISSHVLEHVANPLCALFEWKRVLKGGGTLLLVVPHKQATFDHNRQATKQEHFISDYRNGVDEHDLSHLSEILRFHDLSMDPEAGNLGTFVTRAKDNFANRSLHHHAFVTESVIRITDYVGLRILLVATHIPYHIIVLCKKMFRESDIQETDVHLSNRRFLRQDASWRRSSCFDLDRKFSDVAPSQC